MRGKRRRRARGFTVIELLVVLVIIALAAALAMPRLTAPSDRLQIEAAAQDLVAALRLTRASAIARNGNLALVIDVEARHFESPVVPLRPFASDMTAQLKVAEPERTTPSRGGIRFFPDGSSTGGDVVLALRGREQKICVNWLTGQAGRAPEGRDC